MSDEGFVGGRIVVTRPEGPDLYPGELQVGSVSGVHFKAPITAVTVRRASLPSDLTGDLLVMDPHELARLQQQAALALDRGIEREMLHLVCGADIMADTVTISKAQSCGKSEASAWRGVFGIPDLAASKPRTRHPLGNRAQRRRAHALARKR